MVLNGRWWKGSSIVGNLRSLSSGKGSIIRVPFGSWKSQIFEQRNGPRSGFEVSAELAGILKAKVNLTRFSRTI